MEITQASKSAFDPKPQMSRIFVEGFYPYIKHISPDREKLLKVFTHMFNLECFYLAVEGEKVAAMAAVTGGISPVKLSRNEFAKVLGLVRGTVSYIYLRRHMMHNSLPFAIGPKTGVIEFVATAPEFRKQGIGHKLLSHVITNLPYNSFMLEVADTNPEAFRLYQRLGFKEIKRVSASKRSGANAFIYMRFSCDAGR